MPLNVRPASPSDVLSLPEVERKAGEVFRTIDMDYVSEMPVTSLEVFQTAQQNGHLWIAAVGEEIAGFALTELRDGLAHLTEVSVAPNFARQGLGKLLIESVCVWAKSIGSPCLTLSTFRDVPWNAPYYTRLGFSECAAEDLGPEHTAALETGRQLFPSHPRIAMRKLFTEAE